MNEHDIIVGFCRGCGTHTELDSKHRCVDCFDRELDRQEAHGRWLSRRHGVSQKVINTVVDR